MRRRGQALCFAVARNARFGGMGKEVRPRRGLCPRVLKVVLSADQSIRDLKSQVRDTSRLGGHSPRRDGIPRRLQRAARRPYNVRSMNRTDGSLARKLAVFAADIKVTHTVFALPFALLSTFLAADALPGRTPGWGRVALIVACMVS